MRATLTVVSALFACFVGAANGSAAERCASIPVGTEAVEQTDIIATLDACRSVFDGLQVAAGTLPEILKSFAATQAELERNREQISQASVVIRTAEVGLGPFGRFSTSKNASDAINKHHERASLESHRSELFAKLTTLRSIYEASLSTVTVGKAYVSVIDDMKEYVRTNTNPDIERVNSLLERVRQLDPERHLRIAKILYTTSGGAIDHLSVPCGAILRTSNFVSTPECLAP